MDVISRRKGSGLNPDAAPYVPEAYRAVEDFSAEWWELVHGSPWFRDYWLRECFQEPQNDPDPLDIYDPVLPDDVDSLFYPPHQEEEEAEKKKEERRVDDSLGSGEVEGAAWFMGRTQDAEKAPKIVNPKVSPRAIRHPA